MTFRQLAATLTLGLFIYFPTLGFADEEQTLSLPPTSLAQWYKPQNKRQVWLHTMFRLRREMLAVTDYAALGDQDRLKKWADRLVRDYRKIAEMVPEWEDELRLDWADRLEKASMEGNFKMVLRARKKLENSCNSCHREFRAQAALLYRVPDYHAIEVTDSLSGQTLSFPLFMEELSEAVNRIKIASEDNRKQAALKAMARLKAQLTDLGSTCDQCHQDQVPFNRILGTENQQTLAALTHSIEQGDTKKTGKLLGKAAVAICARCHSVHRTLADLRNAILPIDH